MPKILVKYLDPELKPISQAHEKEWYDLRAAYDYKIEPGKLCYIRLGVCIQLPKDHEAILAMRSSSSKKYGVMPANGIGVIDYKYCGNNDEWIMPVVNFTKKTQIIPKNTRICQFRVMPQQPYHDIIQVQDMKNPDRKGLGSTGNA